METVLKHLQEDKERAEKEEKELWKKMTTNDLFRKALASNSFKIWFIKHMQYSEINKESLILEWRKTVDKVQTLNQMIKEAEEKTNKWKILEKVSKKNDFKK